MDQLPKSEALPTPSTEDLNKLVRELGEKVATTWDQEIESRLGGLEGAYGPLFVLIDILLVGASSVIKNEREFQERRNVITTSALATFRLFEIAAMREKEGKG